jgi:uncharacterized OsmC-like protein
MHFSSGSKADMDDNSRIRTAQQRVVGVFRRKPTAALSTMRASGHLDAGLLCTVRQDRHEAAMDMGAVLGGGDAAPSPGFYIRAGLIGCIAIGIKMTAAREGIQVDSVDVDVEMDFDDSAMLGMGANSAAPLSTRITISLDSPVLAGTVESMVGRALAADPFFLALRDPQSVATTIIIRSV